MEKTTKKKKKSPRDIVNFKASTAEQKAMVANAKKYTGGVVSKWIRLVAADPRFLKTNRVRVTPLKVVRKAA